MMGTTEIKATQAAAANLLHLDCELRIATQLALEAGALLRSRQHEELEVAHKANGEIVTPVDLASNELICQGLAAAFPGDGLYSEEGPPPAVRPGNGRLWIVDPLDSTSNYVQHGDEYSLSIGLAINGEAVLGVVYNPSRDELFSGYRGLGASWNGVPVRTSISAAEHRPRLLVSGKEWKRGVNTIAGGMLVQPMASMAYKLARVASGKEDAVFSLKPRKPWGTCAGTALVSAAGGKITSIDGQPLLFECTGPRAFNGLVAANAKLHPSILALALALHSAMRTRRPA